MGSTQQEKTKVLLFGLGAIGGFYTFILGRNENVSVSVVARSNYESVKRDGLTIESENHGTHKANIDNVYKTPSDANTTFDYIICTNKAINPSSTPPIFHSVVSPSTTFVIIQNGVGNEEPFRTTYPSNTIISCVTWVGAHQPTPGHVKHIKAENTEMGLFPNPTLDSAVEKERLEGFAAMLKGGGTVFTVEEDIQIKRWSKVVWNCAWNPISTLTMVNTKEWLFSCEDAVPITRRLMQEVIVVARACGVPLKDSLVDELMEKIMSLPGLQTSMQVDAQEGRPLEVDVIVGFPLKRARELGIDVPVLTMVGALTMAVNGRIERASA